MQKLDTKLNDLLVVLTESTDKSSTTSMVAGDLYQISELLERQFQGFETEVKDAVEITAEEKRKFPRVDNIVRVTLSQNNIKADGLTLDLSMQGLKVRCAAEFSKQLPVKIEVYQPNISEGGRRAAFELEADLVHSQWVDDCYHYGLKFSGLGLSDTRDLEAIFDYFKKPYRYSQAS